MLQVISNNKTFEINLEKNAVSGTVNGKNFALDVVEKSQNVYHIIQNNKSHCVFVKEINFDNKTVTVEIDSHEYISQIKDSIDILLASLGMNNLISKKVNELKAPMPGLVREITVSEGQQIKKGDTILVLEAMKMENNIKSPADLTIKQIVAKKGNSVEKNQLLVIFD